MPMNNNTIASGQLFILLFVTRITAAIMFPAVISGSGSVWNNFLPLLITFALSFIVMLPFFFCRKDISGIKRIEEVSEKFQIFYILYFIFISVYDMIKLNGFAQELAGKNLNIEIIEAFILLTAVYAAFMGIEAIVRFSAISFAVIVISYIMAVVFLAPSYSSDNLTPLHSVSSSSIYDGTIMILSEITEFAVLFMLFSRTKGKFVRNLIMWNIFSYIFLLLMFILICGSLGEYLIHMPYPFYHLIDGSGTLQRFNPFFIGVTLSGLCCSLSTAFCIIFDSIKKLMPMKNKNSVRVFVSVSAGIYGLTLWLNQNARIKDILFNRYVLCTLMIVFSLILPAAVIIISKSGRKRILRASVSLICVLTILFSFNGCSSVQLNQRLIVQGIGIDKNDNGYQLTLIVLDTESEERENAVKLVYTEGSSVAEAMAGLENQRGKSVLLSQCLFLILNRNAAEESSDSLAYFRHNNDIMKTTNIMVSYESSGETLKTAIEDMGYQSEYINVLSDSKAIDQTAVHFSLFDYVTSVNNPYGDMLLPYIFIDREMNCLKADGSLLVRSGGGQSDVLTPDETVGTLILNKKIFNYTEGINEANLTFSINSASVNIVPQISNKRLRFDFEIELDAVGNSDQAETENIYDVIDGRIESALNKTLKKNGCDVFQLNKYFRSVFPDIHYSADKWHNMLYDCEYHISLAVV